MLLSARFSRGATVAPFTAYRSRSRYLCYTKGVVTAGGMKVLSDFVPEFDATVVSKLKTARAILLGKLNLAEGAIVGYHRDFDIPVNPWGEELWAGVSSSGSGVATAAGLCSPRSERIPVVLFLSRRWLTVSLV